MFLRTQFIQLVMVIVVDGYAEYTWISCFKSKNDLPLIDMFVSWLLMHQVLVNTPKCDRCLKSLFNAAKNFGC